MKKLRLFYGRNFLALELLIALGAAAVFVYLHRYSPYSAKIETVIAGNRGSIYATLASVFGALLGFVITALSIVLGYASDPRLKKLRESKYYPTLWKIFISTTRWLAIVTVVTIAALVFDRDIRPRPGFLYATVAASCISVARVGRVVWVVEKLVWLLVRRTEIAERSHES